MPVPLDMIVREYEAKMRTASDRSQSQTEKHITAFKQAQLCSAVQMMALNRDNEDWQENAVQTASRNERRKAAVACLRQRLDELEARKRYLQAQIVRKELTVEARTRETEFKQAATKAQEEEARQRLQAIHELLERYQSALGLTFRRAAGAVEMVFTCIDRVEPSKEFSIMIIAPNEQRGYEVVACEPPLDNIAELLAALNNGTLDFGTFVRGVRQSFRQYVGEELSPSSSPESSDVETEFNEQCTPSKATLPETALAVTPITDRNTPASPSQLAAPNEAVRGFGKIPASNKQGNQTRPDAFRRDQQTPLPVASSIAKNTASSAAKARSPVSSAARRPSAVREAAQGASRPPAKLVQSPHQRAKDTDRLAGRDTGASNPVRRFAV